MTIEAVHFPDLSMVAPSNYSNETEIEPPLRLALFANNLHPYRVGGMQKHTTMLARHLPDFGVEVDLYYKRDKSQPADDQVRQELFNDNPAVQVCSVHHRSLPRFPAHYYLNCFWESRSLWKAMSAAGKRYDFVYAQGYTGWYGCTVAPKKKPALSRPPVGVHAHGIEALQEEWSTWRLLRNGLAPVWQRRIIQAADVNLSLGGRLDELILSVGGRPDSVLPAYNGIDESWLRDQAEIEDSADTTRFLFVGRDSSRKGFVELKHAAQTLLNEPSFRIDFVGPIAEPHRFTAPGVTYHGVIKDEAELRSIYRSADVLVCPSYSEGMPTVILEAMASGLAVLATDVGAVRLVVGDDSGWLIPPRDPAALCNAMREAMSCSLQSRKRAARKKAESLTWPVVTRLFVDALHAYLRTRCVDPQSRGSA